MQNKVSALHLLYKKTTTKNPHKLSFQLQSERFIYFLLQPGKCFFCWAKSFTQNTFTVPDLLSALLMLSSVATSVFLLFYNEFPHVVKWLAFCKISNNIKKYWILSEALVAYLFLRRTKCDKKASNPHIWQDKPREWLDVLLEVINKNSKNSCQGFFMGY